MSSVRKKVNSSVVRVFSSLLQLSPLVLIICAGFAVYYYREVFPGGFSESSADWSAFGSYVGGIFGPVVSFVTLLAILKTIGLQKELLDTQQREFTAMQSLQQQTFDSQKSQIIDAKRSAELEKVERLKDALLSSIDRVILIHDNRYGRAFSRFERYKNYDNTSRRGDGIAHSLYDEVNKEMETCSRKIRGLELLAREMSTKDFSSTEALRELYSSQIKGLV
ncbi:hypothetical protein [Pseudomonas putida]|uniref:hypothetical protein n=1 Tax=Pseudomonas putida TaxID=303 RepID=UPI0023E373B0|nr:hypothetical protein [Pseudomonas putida]MDF3930497.1 hypothetical protein [Pseudomonas putida]